jgi:hypothetical protein
MTGPPSTVMRFQDPLSAIRWGEKTLCLCLKLWLSWKIGYNTRAVPCGVLQSLGQGGLDGALSD